VGDPSGAIASVATLSSSVNPAVFGQMVVFTANVQSTVPGAGPPSGAVTFQDQGVPLGFGFLNAGQATLALSSLSVGPHSITAVYNGDSNFTPSTSPPLAQIITVASTTTAVSSSADPSVSGQSIIFNASVSAAGPGGGTPTGQVTFQDGSTVLGTVVLSSGHATFTTSSLAVGTHSISAVYSGDVDYAASASALFSQTVNKASSTTALVSSPNPSVFGQSVTLTATVSAVAPGSGVPTGTVSFKDGSFPLLTVVLQSGQATLTSASLSRGSHSLMAVYNGDGQFYGSSSAAVGQSVNNVGSAPSQ